MRCQVHRFPIGKLRQLPLTNSRLQVADTCEETAPIIGGLRSVLCQLDLPPPRVDCRSRFSRAFVGVGEHRLRFCHRPFLQEARRSEEHTSELQSLMRISYAVFCLKKKKQYKTII